MSSTADVSEPLAAIDIGSNSFRLEIGQLHGAQYRRVDYLKETVRLGAGLDAQGDLTPEAIERGLVCLRGFAARLHGLPAARVRAVATQTLREARNRDAFLAQAQQALGHPVEVISGREEARLIYAGVSRLQPGDDEPRLVIDIGGRSTELILGQGSTPMVAESFGIGCVGLSMRFFPDGRITEDGLRRAQVAAGAELEEALQVFDPSRWQRALGSSGTAGAVSQVLQAAGQSDGRITPEGLRWCIERVLEAGHVQRIELPGLKADRRAVLPGGLAILYTLAAQFSIDAIFPAKGALRQGVLFDLHERLQVERRQRDGDVRDTTTRQMQRRFAVDEAQAARVRERALTLFDAAQPAAAAEARRDLAWACELHEIGLMVSHHDHHRHSAYLVLHADAAGFSQNQQQRLADLVLAQRGGLRKVEPALQRETFAWQALCLRLAVIECHARADLGAQRLELQARGQEAIVGFTARWAEQHPRTQFLLAEEAAAWARQGPLKLLLAPH